MRKFKMRYYVNNARLKTQVGRKFATWVRKQLRKGLHPSGDPMPRGRDGGRPLRDTGHLLKNFKVTARGPKRKKKVRVGFVNKGHPDAKLTMPAMAGSIFRRWGRELGLDSEKAYAELADIYDKWWANAKEGKDYGLKVDQRGSKRRRFK